jgi:hypothetical protein
MEHLATSLENTSNMKLQRIEVTLQEVRMSTRPNVYKNKKKYTRKSKHKEQY